MSEYPLTQRMKEVLHLAAKGESQKTIAKPLGISPRTVHVHLDDVHRILGVSTTLQAILEAGDIGDLNLKELATIDEIDKINELTPAQYAVLVKLVEDRGRFRFNKDIAKQVGVSTKTVNVHIRAILNKLNTPNKIRAAVIMAAALAIGFEYKRRQKINKIKNNNK